MFIFISFVSSWYTICCLPINSVVVNHVNAKKLKTSTKSLMKFYTWLSTDAQGKKVKNVMEVPERLSFRVPFGTYSYTSICSPLSKQKPTRLTRFLRWTLDRSSISVLNSRPLCIDSDWTRLMAISWPVGRVPR